MLQALLRDTFGGGEPSFLSQHLAGIDQQIGVTGVAMAQREIIRAS
jgi:hypothetical protein